MDIEKIIYKVFGFVGSIFIAASFLMNLWALGVIGLLILSSCTHMLTNKEIDEKIENINKKLEMKDKN